MVDVNKILNIDVEKEKEKTNIPIKGKSIIEKTYDLSNTVKDFIPIIDVAINRKVPFEAITYTSNNGLLISYDSDLFGKKIKKFAFKSTLKKLNNIIDENSFQEILEELINNYNNYNKLDIRLLFYSNKNWIGFNKSNNTIFINYENGTTEFMLFNTLSPEYTDLENTIFNLQKEEEIDELNDMDNDGMSSINIDENLDTEVIEEPKENDFDFLKTLEGVDELVGKYKK